MISFGTGTLYVVSRKEKIGPGCFLRRKVRIGTVKSIGVRSEFSPDTFANVFPDDVIVVDIPFVVVGVEIGS